MSGCSTGTRTDPTRARHDREQPFRSRTLDRAEAPIKAAGTNVFARIDRHAGAAEVEFSFVERALETAAR